MTLNAPSRPTSPLTFWKLDGAGNDFVALDNRLGRIPEGPVREILIAALCARRTGVGTDGALVLELPGDPAAAHVRMRYHNRDGGEAEMCGNGARCLAAFARHLGAAPARGMRIETRAGIQQADVYDDQTVRLLMPDVAPPRRVGRVDVEGWSGEADAVAVGVPHAVVWVEDLETLAVDSVGRALRHHAAFAPAGANVNFALLPSGTVPSAAARPLPSGAASRVFLRTYERGVECETLACGTGSVATAISGVLAGRAKTPVAARVRGGDDLIIDFDPTREGGARRVSLTGPARILFRAETHWLPETGDIVPFAK